MIKIADKLSKLNSILNSPPKDWPPERKREYFEWAKQVVAGCSGINSSLDKAFVEIYAKGSALF